MTDLAHPLPKPVRLDPAFGDLARVQDCVRRGAPYRLLSVVDRSYAAEHYTPWFRAYWVVPGRTFLPEALPLFHEPRLVRAAQRCFDAEVVRPQTLMVNLTGPMPAGPAHVDLPHFRGAPARTHPMELLYAMGSSGLFERWAIRVASALVWFHRGEGGAFECWPEGPDRPSRTHEPPLWNVGVVGDNDRMLHRARAVGPAAAELPADLLERSATLHTDADGGFRIQHGERIVRRYPARQVRISILWKAHVFADAEAAARYDAGEDPLDPETIVRVFADDARQRGHPLPEPSDPLDDRDWIRAVAALHSQGHVRRSR